MMGRKTAFLVEVFAKVTYYIGRPLGFFLFWVAFPTILLLITLRKLGAL